MTNQFVMTENHIKLLKRMYVRFNDRGYDGAPEVDLKRPYGNSDVVGDIYEITRGGNIPEDEYGERDDDIVDQMLDIHREIATALQIALCTLSFIPGVYVQRESYDSLSWYLKE